MEIQLTLRFACCFCGHDITATLACKGAGLHEATDERVAAVALPCPTCDDVCQLLFDPRHGKVREVRAWHAAQPIPEPSIN